LGKTSLKESTNDGKDEIARMRAVIHAKGGGRRFKGQERKDLQKKENFTLK
jgi:hypothetical protein